jgi:hypothetical protein
MGGLIDSALACSGSSLGSNPDISQKYRNSDIRKGVAKTLQTAKKNIYKKLLVSVPD